MSVLSRPMGSGPTSGRLWPRWVALAVVVVGLVVAFVNLGQWQLDRLEQRRERNETVIVHENSPVREFDEVFTTTITEADQWQRVRVSGTFDPDHQLLAIYRANGGPSQGYEVVAPLRLTDGSAVLVSLGWAARPSGEGFPTTAPPPPTGTVTVTGHVRRDEQGPPEAITPGSGQVRLINSTAIAATLPYPLRNGYLGALEVTPTPDNGLEPVRPPELTEGNHLSYAFQWFAFSAIAGVGLVLMIRSDLVARRRAATESKETS